MDYSITHHPNHDDLVEYALEKDDDLRSTLISKHIEYCDACSGKTASIKFMKFDLIRGFNDESANNLQDVNKNNDFEEREKIELEERKKLMRSIGGTLDE